MKFSEVYFSLDVENYLRDRLSEQPLMAKANAFLSEICGIQDFFDSQQELDSLADYLVHVNSSVHEPQRAEYGDFQTNLPLAKKIVAKLAADNVVPQLLIEPTFGKGNFILAALHSFPNLETIVGIEIYGPYFWETKFAILDFFLQNRERTKPAIRLFHQDVFTFDFQNLSREYPNERILILGNPPWVTNARLGALNSDNLPVKSNFKNLNGFDAITGKGNFDIGEYITITLLRAFHQTEGWMAFLVKTAVIRNIIFDQHKFGFHLSRMIQKPVDAQKEFGAAVEAALFFCHFNSTPEAQCVNTETGQGFGWVDNQFVSDILKYADVRQFDGLCPFEWRQGLKHDCSVVMELEREGKNFRNGNGKAVCIENDLVHGLLKSSDLKGGVVAAARKFTIVTQRKVGQDTAYIEHLFPLTYHYLNANRLQFEDRKSSIYKGKPSFSIFGIGDYSFLPYKVAISGLYRSATFTLVLPVDDKPMMLDDTCYFIGFETLTEASLVFALLNHPSTQGLLNTITFSGAKRRYTKDVLMRIDLPALAETINYPEIRSYCALFAGLPVPTERAFADFLGKMNPEVATTGQLQLF